MLLLLVACGTSEHSVCSNIVKKLKAGTGVEMTPEACISSGLLDSYAFCRENLGGGVDECVKVASLDPGRTPRSVEPVRDDVQTWPEEWLVAFLEEDDRASTVQVLTQCYAQSLPDWAVGSWSVTSVTATGPEALEAKVRVQLRGPGGTSRADEAWLSRGPVQDGTTSYSVICAQP